MVENEKILFNYHITIYNEICVTFKMTSNKEGEWFRENGTARVTKLNRQIEREEKIEKIKSLTFKLWPEFSL